SATLVALKAPSTGRWTVSGEGVTSIATAAGVATPSVRARVRGRVLTYTVRDGEGWTITLAEQGARTFHVLGRAGGARGTIRFTPAAGRAERRRIVARFERDGVPAPSATVGSYRAPAAGGLQAPRLRVVRGVARWTPVAGAVRYAVTLVPARGERVLRPTRA